jgi:Protein of unknown function (DUF3574)
MFLLALASCTPASRPTSPSQPAPYSCLMPAETRMLVAELFFGRGIRGRKPLTDTEWAEFAAQFVTPNFPAGFTVFDGEGQWRDPRTGHIDRSPTKVLLVAAERGADLAPRLSAVIEAYRTKFHQQSVGLITRDSCAAF